MTKRSALPKAEEFVQVMNLLNRMRHDAFSREAGMYLFDIPTRQFDYYTGATIYLGLAEQYLDCDGDGEDLFYRLTSLGEEIMELHRYDRYHAVTDCIFRHEIFHRTYSLFLKRRKFPTQEKIIEIIKQSKEYALDSDEDLEQCALVIVNWVSWILSWRRY